MSTGRRDRPATQPASAANQEALRLLLLYNREDVTNLALLRTRLGVD